MKKLIPSLLILANLLFLPSCQLVEDLKTSYNNLFKEGKAMMEKAEKTKDELTETVKDIENAAKKADETYDALKEVTK